MGVVNYWTEHCMSYVMLCYASQFGNFLMSAPLLWPLRFRNVNVQKIVHFVFCMDGKFRKKHHINLAVLIILLFISNKFSRQWESFWFKSTKNERAHFLFTCFCSGKKNMIEDSVSSNNSYPCQHIFLVNDHMFSSLILSHINETITYI